MDQQPDPSSALPKIYTIGGENDLLRARDQSELSEEDLTG
jgi:hypothetical protein